MRNLIMATAFVCAAGTAFAQTTPGLQAPDSNSSNYQAKGQQAKEYTFPGTDEKIPYEIYVPMKWTKQTKLPLIVLTHGANQPATAPFQRPMSDPTLAKFAEERGFIVAAVTGYHANATGVPTGEGPSGWNVPYKAMTVPRPPRPQAAPGAEGAGRPGGQRPGGAAGAGRGRGPAGPPATEEDFKRAEQDVLNVRQLMMQEYNVDPNRVYLMGNSSGGTAVWNIGAKYPELWTAISMSAGPIEDADFPYEKLKSVPVLVVHGDMDTTMQFEGSKTMVDHAKAKGLTVEWLPVAGGMHVDAWALPDVMKQEFDFFDKYKSKQKKAGAPSGARTRKGSARAKK